MAMMSVFVAMIMTAGTTPVLVRMVMGVTVIMRLVQLEIAIAIVTFGVFMPASAVFGVTSRFMAMIMTAGARLAVLMVVALRVPVFVIMTTSTGRCCLGCRLAIVAALTPAGMLLPNPMLLILML